MAWRLVVALKLFLNRSCIFETHAVYFAVIFPDAYKHDREQGMLCMPLLFRFVHRRLPLTELDPSSNLGMRLMIAYVYIPYTEVDNYPVPPA